MLKVSLSNSFLGRKEWNSLNFNEDLVLAAAISERRNNMMFLRKITEWQNFHMCVWASSCHWVVQCVLCLLGFWKCSLWYITPTLFGPSVWDKKDQMLHFLFVQLQFDSDTETQSLLTLALRLWRSSLQRSSCFLVSSLCWHYCSRVTHPLKHSAPWKASQDDLCSGLTVVFLCSNRVA